MGFGARLLARRCAEALDSAIEDESIFALLASARWDRVRAGGGVVCKVIGVCTVERRMVECETKGWRLFFMF